MSNIKPWQEHPCREWPAYINPQGYGEIGRRHGLKNLRAHRIVWEAVHGPIPDGLVIDHLCRNRACVNPAHLEVVTQYENVRRGEGPSAINGRKTHCKHGHEFTDETTKIDKKGRRDCLVCKKIRDKSRTTEQLRMQSLKRKEKRDAARAAALKSALKGTTP